MTTSTITEHKKCICVEFGTTNNNKVWQYTIYDDGTALTEWGRVGSDLQSKVVTPAQAYKKWAEKTRPNNNPDKRYTEVKSVDSSSLVSSGSVKTSQLQDVARKQIKHNNPLISELIDYLVKENSHQILHQSGGKITYDASSATFKTPLGVINPSQVNEARSYLVEISDFVNSRDFNNSSFNKVLNSYLRLIPHDVGMSKISPELIFPNTQSVIAENDLLDGLETSFIDVTTKSVDKTASKKDNQPNIFDVDLQIIDDDKIINNINSNLITTSQRGHSCSHLKLKKVYSINIHTMADNFKKEVIGNIRELYHGTRSHNLLSILRQGLIIPPASASHCTGRLLGNGCYFASAATKSLNYSYGYWDGSRNNRCFMFIAEVALGKHYTPNSLRGPFPKPGHDSVWAKAGQTGSLQNDEFVVYRTSQSNFKYLLEFN